eukprot:1985431-Amphidinium_carterae.1
MLILCKNHCRGAGLEQDCFSHSLARAETANVVVSSFRVESMQGEQHLDLDEAQCTQFTTPSEVAAELLDLDTIRVVALAVSSTTSRGFMASRWGVCNARLSLRWSQTAASTHRGHIA